MVTAAMKLKDTCSLEKSYDLPRQHIKKQRHYFANKIPPSESYDFFLHHVWMWELDYKERWAPKNWCLWTVVLEKTLESPLECKEIKPVNPKWDQSWIFIGRTDDDAEAPILWPLDVKTWFIGKDPDAGKDWRRKEKGKRGWDGWMASLTQWTWICAHSWRWWTALGSGLACRPVTTGGLSTVRVLLVTGMSPLMKCPSGASAHFPHGPSAFPYWFVGSADTCPGIDSHVGLICSGELPAACCSVSSCSFDDREFLITFLFFWCFYIL